MATPFLFSPRMALSLLTGMGISLGAVAASKAPEAASKAASAPTLASGTDDLLPKNAKEAKAFKEVAHRLGACLKPEGTEQGWPTVDRRSDEVPLAGLLNLKLVSANPRMADGFKYRLLLDTQQQVWVEKSGGFAGIKQLYGPWKFSAKGAPTLRCPQF
ncbi:MAG: hypothetical protein E6Q92_04355 [Burkholderiaceae bacterium]|nr:MAG: hypothetical protein E6Q92_04355 [Burkholderiaceae bacterium]